MAAAARGSVLWGALVARRCFSSLGTASAFERSHLFRSAVASARENRVAIIDQRGSFTYRQLLDDSEKLARQIRDRLASAASTTSPACIAFLCPRDFDYVSTQWAIWRAGGIAVPLSSHSSPAELSYYASESDSRIVVLHESLADAFKSVQLPPACHSLSLKPSSPSSSSSSAPSALPETTGSAGSHWGDAEAMIVFTSGTTGKPKGVLTTHGNLDAQIRMLVEAWEWSASDRILHVLPLHHVHGIVNCLLCPLYVGATCEMAPTPFNVPRTWETLCNMGSDKNAATLFMAVPTIYHRMLEYYDSLSGLAQSQIRRWMLQRRHLRLMVSGSAPLPPQVLERWEVATARVLLERYGMTEFGMALSNPVRGDCVAGSVGFPLPYVEAFVAAEDANPPYSKAARPGETGELLIRGPHVFSRYWRRPEATAESFTRAPAVATGGIWRASPKVWPKMHDSIADEDKHLRDDSSRPWFITGDAVEVDGESGRFSIKGRKSVDIIKTGGYKLSALDIETVLQGHPGVAEVAVVGVPDAEYGERVGAVIVPRAWLGREERQDDMEYELRRSRKVRSPEALLSVKELDVWTEPHLARYKRPSLVRLVKELPRNAMGKVNKKSLLDLFQEKSTGKGE